MRRLSPPIQLKPQRAFVPFQMRRSFYSKPAKFTVTNEWGSSTTQVDVWIGDPHESFVLVPREIGYTIKRWSNIYNHSTNITDSCSLIFHHTTRKFLIDSSIPYPNLTIPQNLPQSLESDTSPATLYLFGVTHTIALDGSFDAEFTQHLKESLNTLKRPLDKLKNM